MSFLSRGFAVCSLVLVLAGAGCSDAAPSPTKTPVLNDTGIDLGFTVAETAQTGRFLTARDEYQYHGAYEKYPEFNYGARLPPEPDAPEQKTSYVDYLGYRKNADGIYELNFLGQSWERLMPDLDTVFYEVQLVKGKALVLESLPVSKCKGSSLCFPPPRYVAYINTPHGPLPGGSFVGHNLPLADFEAALKRVSIE